MIYSSAVRQKTQSEFTQIFTRTLLLCFHCVFVWSACSGQKRWRNEFSWALCDVTNDFRAILACENQSEWKQSWTSHPSGEAQPHCCQGELFWSQWYIVFKLWHLQKTFSNLDLHNRYKNCFWMIKRNLVSLLKVHSSAGLFVWFMIVSLCSKTFHPSFYVFWLITVYEREQLRQLESPQPIIPIGISSRRHCYIHCRLEMHSGEERDGFLQRTRWVMQKPNCLCIHTCCRGDSARRGRSRVLDAERMEKTEFAPFSSRFRCNIKPSGWLWRPDAGWVVALPTYRAINAQH